MKFNVIKAEINTYSNDYETKIELINSYEDYLKYEIITEDQNINEEFFKTNSLISIIFFDGSVPKREIKELRLDEENKEIKVITNKEDLKFSSMDLRRHFFLLAVDKISINKFSLK